MIRKTINRIEALLYLLHDYVKVLSAPKETIFILGAPAHSNLGDQAQTYCARRLMQKIGNGVSVRDITTRSALTMNSNLLKLARRKLTKGSLVVLHSGYHMTDIYEIENKLILETLRLFTAQNVLILPQTINYTDMSYVHEMHQSLRAHGSVQLMCRDEVSHSFAQKHFPEVKMLLYPDIVTSLVGTDSYDYERSGILLCMRKDVESKYGDDIGALTEKLSSISQRVDLSDTTLKKSPLLTTLFRTKIIEDFWKNMASYRVVITDRYHGTIFSVMTSTRVIVLDSTDHKLSSGVRWFSNVAFRGRIKYVKSIDEAVKVASQLYKEQSLSRPENYFVKKYWNSRNLQAIIDGFEGEN